MMLVSANGVVKRDRTIGHLGESHTAFEFLEADFFVQDLSQVDRCVPRAITVDQFVRSLVLLGRTRLAICYEKIRRHL